MLLEQVCGCWVQSLRLRLGACLCLWVHVYGSVGRMYAVVGCKSAETFACMSAAVGCKFHTAESLPDSG